MVTPHHVDGARQQGKGRLSYRILRAIPRLDEAGTSAGPAHDEAEPHRHRHVGCDGIGRQEERRERDMAPPPHTATNLSR